MAAKLKATNVLLIAAVMIMAVALPSEAAMGCETVLSYLNSCIPYLTDKGQLGNCCSGVKGLYGAAQTTADKQSVCGCLESLAGLYADLNYGKAAAVPGQCRRPLTAQK